MLTAARCDSRTLLRLGIGSALSCAALGFAAPAAALGIEAGAPVGATPPAAPVPQPSAPTAPPVTVSVPPLPATPAPPVAVPTPVTTPAAPTLTVSTPVAPAVPVPAAPATPAVSLPAVPAIPVVSAAPKVADLVAAVKSAPSKIVAAAPVKPLVDAATTTVGKTTKVAEQVQVSSVPAAGASQKSPTNKSVVASPQQAPTVGSPSERGGERRAAAPATVLPTVETDGSTVAVAPGRAEHRDTLAAGSLVRPVPTLRDRPTEAATAFGLAAPTGGFAPWSKGAPTAPPDEPGRGAQRAALPAPAAPPAPLTTALGALTSGTAGTALILLLCLSIFLWVAPPLRRWLRRQPGSRMLPAFVAPLERPG